MEVADDDTTGAAAAELDVEADVALEAVAALEDDTTGAGTSAGGLAIESDGGATGTTAGRLETGAAGAEDDVEATGDAMDAAAEVETAGTAAAELDTTAAAVELDTAGGAAGGVTMAAGGDGAAEAGNFGGMIDMVGMVVVPAVAAGIVCIIGMLVVGFDSPTVFTRVSVETEVTVLTAAAPETVTVTAAPALHGSVTVTVTAPGTDAEAVAGAARLLCFGMLRTRGMFMLLRAAFLPLGTNVAACEPRQPGLVMSCTCHLEDCIPGLASRARGGRQERLLVRWSSWLK